METGEYTFLNSEFTRFILSLRERFIEGFPNEEAAASYVEGRFADFDQNNFIALDIKKSLNILADSGVAMVHGNTVDILERIGAVTDRRYGVQVQYNQTLNGKTKKLFAEPPDICTTGLHSESDLVRTVEKTFAKNKYYQPGSELELIAAANVIDMKFESDMHSGSIRESNRFKFTKSIGRKLSRKLTKVAWEYQNAEDINDLPPEITNPNEVFFHDFIAERVIIPYRMWEPFVDSMMMTLEPRYYIIPDRNNWDFTRPEQEYEAWMAHLSAVSKQLEHGARKDRRSRKNNLHYLQYDIIANPLYLSQGVPLVREYELQVMDEPGLEYYETDPFYGHDTYINRRLGKDRRRAKEINMRVAGELIELYVNKMTLPFSDTKTIDARISEISRMLRRR